MEAWKEITLGELQERCNRRCAEWAEYGKPGRTACWECPERDLCGMIENGDPCEWDFEGGLF